jgi:hypothetical protein
VELCRVHSFAFPNFFRPAESVSRWQSAYEWGSVVTTRRIVNCCEMMERLEQQYCIKFWQKLGDTQVKTIHKIQQVFGDDAMSISHIKEWFNLFKDGRTSVDSEPRPGRLSTSEIHAEAADDGTGATLFINCTGHAGQCKQWPQLPEHLDH